MFYLKYMKLIY